MNTLLESDLSTVAGVIGIREEVVIRIVLQVPIKDTGNGQRAVERRLLEGRRVGAMDISKSRGDRHCELVER